MYILYTGDDFSKLHVDSPYIEAEDGRRFLVMSNVAYMTKGGSVKIKDRLNNNVILDDGEVIPVYEICDGRKRRYDGKNDKSRRSEGHCRQISFPWIPKRQTGI